MMIQYRLLLSFIVALHCFFTVVTCYPQLVPSYHINIDVWAEVMRRSCVELAQLHVITDYHTFHGGLEYHGGW